ncbi:deoxyribodipyrimidine photo-lyase [Methanocella sp. MCL-LM]|uniref:deoxyribodipyrimidine photo-lyase n=1 Tax=Methanocella sp. MCL-LM TaxID=3412035 RepID=UPI003C76B72A
MDRALESRITKLNDRGPADGKCVVYWMQSSLRAGENPALAAATSEANRRRLPLLVLFSIDPAIPSANRRSFAFMAEALRDTVAKLEAAGAQVCIRTGDAVENLVRVGKEVKPAVIVTDESHLNEGRSRREAAAGRAGCAMFQVDGNVIVPVRLIPGEQYAAYTLRPRLAKLLEEHIRPVPQERPGRRAKRLAWSGLDPGEIMQTVDRLSLPEVPSSPLFRGGETEADKTLERFVEERLDGYAENRNRPELYFTSDLSPYLRFGCISPARVIRRVLERRGELPEEVDAFVEEAFVRRELAENFTFYDRRYRSLASLPDWAVRTLDDHRKDRRQHLFTLEELEEGRTGDELWDAAQREMLVKGKMAGYMRMYWGKRVLEWTRTPEEALRILLYLNDKYEIDGRSPNGYAGVLWCFGKHDRAFAERPVYGKIRYMSPAAQRKKFDIREYIRRGSPADIKR